ncbi:MAG: 23S rRNA (uracil(1939)-C(5))-methyltransferase RlmD [Chitinispirillaceae bacterium]|jgi:23S rRNA (uracil1939-C5)-methyltransferase
MVENNKQNTDKKSCPHFGRCGGCQALNKYYEGQLAEKKDRLRSLFSFAGFPSLPDVLPSPQIYHYRHKVQLPFGCKKQGKIILGCYAGDSHEVVDQHVCLIQDEELSRIAWSIRDWAREAGLSVYNEKTDTGFLRHVLLRKGAETGEILIGLVTNGGRPIGLRRLADTLLAAVEKSDAGVGKKVVGIVQNVNTRQTNVVLGEQEFAWWGRPFLFEKLGPHRYKVGLSTFFQVNPFQTPRLYDEVLRWIENGPAVVDCYCGVGSISLWVAKKSRIVTGIEESRASIAAAKKAAEFNGVRNVRFMQGEVGADFSRLSQDFDVAIFDPPRKGLQPAVIQALAGSSIKRVLYVSCNPVSLAREVPLLLPAWQPVSLQGVDMFPHTDHIECVAVLDRR